MSFLTAMLVSVNPVMSETLNEADIKKLALEAILENPQIIMEAVNLLRDRDEADKEASKKTSISG